MLDNLATKSNTVYLSVYDEDVETKYPISQEDLNLLDRDFEHHPPINDQTARYKIIRATGKVFARIIMAYCPPSRERTIARRAIEDAIMWANAAIARNEAKKE